MPHLSEILVWRFVFPKKILLVERIPIESVDKENELLRGKSRYSKLLSSYPPQIDVGDTCRFCSVRWTECVCLERLYRIPSTGWTPSTVHYLQTSSEMLRFQVREEMRHALVHSRFIFRFEPEIEPMFFTLALFDFKERKKVCHDRWMKMDMGGKVIFRLDLGEFPFRFQFGCVETDDSSSSGSRWIDVESLGDLSDFLSFAGHLSDHSRSSSKPNSLLSDRRVDFS